METRSDQTPDPIRQTRCGRHVFLERDSKRRYLVNTSPVGIRRLLYSSVAYYFDMPGSGDLSVSSRPYYEVLDLPGGAKLHVEDVDPYEDGAVAFYLDEIEWEDGLVERNETLTSQQHLYHLLATRGRHEELLALKEESVTEIAEITREKHLIKTAESHTVYANQKTEGEES